MSLSLAVKPSLRAASRAVSSRQLANATAPHFCQAIRHNSTTAEANPKISSIVDQISNLTLIETADLVALLKSRLNIQDIAIPTAAAAAPAAAAAAAEPEPEPVQEKTMFNVKLDSFEAGAKPKIIKEVKALLGLNLVESKKFVESAPKILRENVTKDDAEKIKATLEGLGAKITLE
ncbi:ribosomal protein L7/L12 C-terminal domain-containing protein [Lipomyces tetrasporus]|uniref:Ribosomal protein L7/L12 C-terminal domain-containing protein n=1 Tax=Lipomyces tetrasporus TaxID=54092 RepID=A0AAD7VS56_9ASCO|nr:ribosomal protein L7/L12 C-terminal domain-containing protein [Lipomyces tetrasporus]KAJ8099983.1 ribosomal protein L7/L12 C-terminal domain-containing protein [Lipomyces tetrasporus]